MLKYVLSDVYSLDDYKLLGIDLTDRYICGAGSHISYNLLRYAVTKAAQGHEKIRKSFLEVYKRDCRAEYNTLKRFSSLNLDDIIGMIGVYEDVDQVYALARILFFADIMKIKIEKPGLYYETIRRLWNRFDSEFNGLLAVNPMPVEKVVKLIDDEESMRILEQHQELMRVGDICDVIMGNAGIASVLGFSEMADPDLHLIRAVPYYLAIMNNCLDFELTEQEKIWGSVFACIIENIRSYMDDMDLEISQLIGMEKQECEDFLGKIWRTSVPAKETPKEASEKNRLLQEEIQSLKEQLRTKDAELTRANLKIRSLENGLISSERDKATLMKRLEKLVQTCGSEGIKETLPDAKENPEKLPSLSVDEKIAILHTRKVCIVGGHPNWTSKLKELFPDWIYLKPESVSSVGEDALNSVEHVFFFTDTLSHASFRRYFTAAKAKNIPIGYLHAINLARAIDELYCALYPGKNN